MSAGQQLFLKKQYHVFNDAVIEKKVIHLKRGRPKTGDKVEEKYSCNVKYNAISEEQIIEMQYQKGIFVIGTNDFASSVEKIISIYKKDQQGVERSFRFLKSSTYFAEAFFFKNTKRIVATLTIMTISLLIYSLLERKIRMAIEERKEPIPNQVGKPTMRPTLNWINQCFEGIDLICHKIKSDVSYIFVRMSKIVKQVLYLLGDNYVKRYSIEMLI